MKMSQNWIGTDSVCSVAVLMVVDTIALIIRYLFYFLQAEEGKVEPRKTV